MTPFIDQITFMPPKEASFQKIQDDLNQKQSNAATVFECSPDEHESFLRGYYLAGEYLTCCVTVEYEKKFSVQAKTVIKVKNQEQEIRKDSPAVEIINSRKICRSTGIQLQQGKSYVSTGIRFSNATEILANDTAAGFQGYITAYNENELSAMSNQTGLAKIGIYTFLIVLLPQGIESLYNVFRSLMKRDSD